MTQLYTIKRRDGYLEIRPASRSYSELIETHDYASVAIHILLSIKSPEENHYEEPPDDPDPIPCAPTTRIIRFGTRANVYDD